MREITRKESQTVHMTAGATDEAGAFAALADVRDGPDRIAKGAFDRTIKRWQESGEQVPLYWLETPSFPTLIGSVDPATFRDTGTFAPFFKGSIDLEGDHRAEARHAWTAVKAGAADLKLDYMLLDSDEHDGVRTLQELDVTGLTLDPTAEAHALIRKADAADLRELRRESDRVLFEVAIGGLDLDAIEAAREPEPAVPTMAELREQAKALGIHVPPPREGSAEWFRDDMLRLLDAGTGPSAAGPQRKSTAPGQIATFEAPAALAQRFSISPRRGNPLGRPGSAR